MTSTTLSPSDLARQTPPSRDRYVDFLRLFSIAVVVLGHWLMAVVVWRGHEFHTGNAIAMTPGLWLATWLLQVMPIFFFVGGFANLTTIDAHHRRGEGAAEFIASRVGRLLKPVGLLVAVWLPAAFVMQHLGLDPRVVRSATRLVCQPLWFIGVYLGVTALAPCMRELHARHGVRAAAALAGTAIAVDLMRFGAHVDAFGYVNVLVVWLFTQQLGFFYADGSLRRITPAQLGTMAVGALGVLAALTSVGPYPRSMVGLPGDRISNMSPPTICLVVLTIFQVAVVMLLRTRVQRALEGARLWTAVVAGNGMIMTIFLWHLTAALLAIAALHALGAPQFTGGSAVWWATRPIWIACAALPLFGLLTAFARFERPRALRYERAGSFAPAAAGFGAALLAVAIFGIALSNISDLLANHRVVLAIVSVTPVQLLFAALAGLTIVHRSAPRAAKA
ncbi:MAG TPA: acyltransferase [Acidimicrobiia bacterium]|nr:acyltransferase [Acidimicrobiia bacterium]